MGALGELDSFDVVLLIAFSVAVVIDWWAVATRRKAIEMAAKPLSTALLVVLAITSGGPDGWTRAFIVTAALFGLAGDVALLDDSDQAFMAGLGSFALGHMAYVGAALSVGVGWSALWAVPYMGLLLGWRFVPETVPGARRAGGTVLAGAVVFYASVISAMVVSATGTGIALAAIGAMLFAVSDWVLGYDKFVRSINHGHLLVHVTYYIGQLALILALAHT